MVKVVMVARGFPPSFDSSSRRPWKLAKYLPEHGVEVVVVTRFRPAQPAGFGLPAAVEVIGTDGVAGDDGPRRETTNSASRRPRVAGALGRYLPIDGDALWSLRAMEVAARIARHRGGIVWVTSGPPSLLVAALWRHLRNGIDYIADFRDVWTDAPVFARTKSAVARSVARQLERKVLREARLVTTVSGTWVPLFENRGARACHEVSNGFDPADRPSAPPPGASESGAPFLAYAGRLRSGLRNTAALERVLRLLPAEYAVHYFGPDADLFREISRPLASRARVEGMLPLEDLLDRLRWASGLIAVGGEGDNWESRGAVPAKIYEYMLTERPILYLGTATHEAARRVALYPRGSVVDPGAKDGDFLLRVRGFLNAGADRTPLRAEERRLLEERWGYPQLAKRLAELIQEGCRR